MPVVKDPTLRSVLKGLDSKVKDPATRIRSSQILARAVTMCLASMLADTDYRQELGMALTHHRLLQNVGKKLWARTRDYSALSSEIRRLLKEGPTVYYRNAVRELGAMTPRGSR